MMKPRAITVKRPSFFARETETDPAGRTGQAAWPPLLRIAFRVGLAVFGAQLICFMLWSDFQQSRFGFSFDFSIYAQGWYQIAHGSIDPFVTSKGAYLWQDHSAFLFWLAAPLWFVWPHPVTLMWLQDAACVAAEVVAFRWMCEVAVQRQSESESRRTLVTFVSVGALALVLDPWITWSITNDFHVEAFSMLFVLLAARDFYNFRQRSWLWVALALGTGNLAATYLIGLSLSALAVGKNWRRTALYLSLAGIGWTELISLIHGDLGSAYKGYSYLLSESQAKRARTTGQGSVLEVAIGGVTHPARVFARIWGYRWSIWADLSSAGLIGIVSPWAFGVPLVAMIESSLNSTPDFISPNTGSQNFPEYLLTRNSADEAGQFFSHRMF